MKDLFNINGHKLIYHIPQLKHWLDGEEAYPIYVELGIYGGCNHRCIFCAFDYLQYKPDALKVQCLKRFIRTAAKNKVKSVLFSGEGEPLLHEDICEIVKFTKEKGIDAAISTNGVLLNQNIAKKILPDLSWIRFSINAGTKKTYALIHQAPEKDFITVIKNLENAVTIKVKRKYKCTIGVQFLLMSQNIQEAENIAATVKNIGADYLVVKPYCPHPMSNKKMKVDFNAKDLNRLKNDLKKICGKDLNVIIRNQYPEDGQGKKTYKRCFGFNFATHITAAGDVYPCNAFVGKRNFTYGNICRQPFDKIWRGPRRKKVVDKIYKSLDLNKCRNSCRLDKINQYLWELKNPVPHANFI